MSDIRNQSKLLNYIKAFVLAVMSGLAITVSNGTQIITDEAREKLIGPVASAIWQIRNSFQPDYAAFMFILFLFLLFVEILVVFIF